MGKHLRNRFSDKEVKEIFERYLSKEIGWEQVTSLLKIKRSGFFKLLKAYRKAPDSFSLDYKRTKINRKIDEKSEQKILAELKKEAKLIANPDNPVRDYNYSFIREILEEKHKVKVSLSTIITRAKKGGFIKKRSLEKSTTARF